MPHDMPPKTPSDSDIAHASERQSDVNRMRRIEEFGVRVGGLREDGMLYVPIAEVERALTDAAERQRRLQEQMTITLTKAIEFLRPVPGSENVIRDLDMLHAAAHEEPSTPANE